MHSIAKTSKLAVVAVLSAHAKGQHVRMRSSSLHCNAWWLEQSTAHVLDASRLRAEQTSTGLRSGVVVYMGHCLANKQERRGIKSSIEDWAKRSITQEYEHEQQSYNMAPWRP
jgi:hypothetical protein